MKRSRATRFWMGLACALLLAGLAAVPALAGWKAIGNVNIKGHLWALCCDNNGNLIVGGGDGGQLDGVNFTTVSGDIIGGIALWNGNTWAPMGSGLQREENPPGNADISSPVIVKDIVLDPATGNLFVSGSFTLAGDKKVNNIAMWDGKEWHPLGEGLASEKDISEVWALAYDTKRQRLYAIGSFTRSGSTPLKRIAMWDGTTWHALGEGLEDVPIDIAVDSNTGQLFVSSFDPRSFAIWDQDHWITDKASSTSAKPCNTLVIDDSGIAYAPCFSDMSNGLSFSTEVMRWNGTLWEGLGGGATVFGPQLAVDHKNRLYVTEVSTAYNGSGQTDPVETNGLAMWDGEKWHRVGGGGIFFGPLAYDRKNGLLYATGLKGFNGPGVDQNPVELNGIGVWQPED